MINLLRRKTSPIGLDIGDRSVKLVQLNASRTALVGAVRYDLRGDEIESAEQRQQALIAAIKQCRSARSFRGRDVVLNLSARELFVQNIRIPKVTSAEMPRVINEELRGRLPFPAAEAEIRYIEAADVRQGDEIKREVILLACHRPVLDGLLQIVDEAGLRALAVDVEPLAMLRAYSRLFRRDTDQKLNLMFVHIGESSSVVVIARGKGAVFVKYVNVCGRNFDQAVAKHLKMDIQGAAALRRRATDRRAENRDPEVLATLHDALRPVMDQLAKEISLCARYHTVTFRGMQLDRLVLGGGEASPALVEELATRLNMKCELGDPLRDYGDATATGRHAQWDVALGLALRGTEPRSIGQLEQKLATK